MKSAALRAQVEASLGFPFTYRQDYTPETAPWGVPSMDALTGGLPRGGLVEIVGPASSGRTSLLHLILAQATAREECCALIDLQDAFEPRFAEMAGINLKRLLWIRCYGLEPALKVADLVLQSGGFGVAALDMSGITPKFARRVPLSFWFRLRRAIEYTSTVLVLLEQEASAASCASLALRTESHYICWPAPAIKTGPSEARTRNKDRMSPHACLLSGVHFRASVLRSRMQRPRHGPDAACFELGTLWEP
ncbi:MAG: hypothetical protein ACRD3O_06995 [Terriglobia bacterium]